MKLVEVVLPGKVEPEGLEIRHGAVPAAGRGQVVIAMEATGISFAEQQMRRGRYYDQPAFPFVPGYDLVGTVLATGEGVDPGLAGTRVAALPPGSKRYLKDPYAVKRNLWPAIVVVLLALACGGYYLNERGLLYRWSGFGKVVPPPASSAGDGTTDGGKEGVKGEAVK